MTTVITGDKINELGTILKECRQEAGKTQEDVANEMGITQPQVSTIESNKTIPQIPTIIDYLAVCGYRLAFVGKK